MGGVDSVPAMHHRTPRLLLAGALTALTIGACGDDADTTGSTGTSGPRDGNTLTVRAFDALKFDKDAYETSAGEVSVVYENDGSIAHTLLIRGVGDFKLSVGDTDEGTVELDAGSYELYCDIAGHEAAGMVADLTVS